jgi:hypothetical protein
MTNNAEREGFRKSYGEVIKALADIVANAPQTDEQCDAELIPRPYVMDRVVRIREAMDALSKLWQARAQASGVPDTIAIGNQQSPNREAYADGWNACREAMLASSPTPPKSASVPVERLEAFISQHGGNATHACDENEVLSSLAELIAEYK